VSQAHENAGLHHSIHPTKNSQDKENETSDLVTARIGHQIDIIDLEDETQDTKILSLLLSV
jgi:hypothetical protein